MTSGSIPPNHEVLIAQWEQTLATYEVVACTERWNQLPEVICEDTAGLLAQPLNPSLAALFVSFDGLMGRRYSAFLLTELQWAVVYYEKDGELCEEFIGLMSLDEFWAFLDSFPNAYRHLYHNALKPPVH